MVNGREANDIPRLKEGDFGKVKIKKTFVVDNFFSETCRASLREDVIHGLKLEDCTYDTGKNKKLERLYKDKHEHIWALTWDNIEQEYYLKFLEY